MVTEARIPETGRYYHAQHLIVLREGMTVMSRRCALAHELAHHHYRDIRSTPRVEARADRWAANQLITVDDVVSCAHEHPEHPERWCDELTVTPHMLRTWLSIPSNYHRAELLWRETA